MKGINTRPDWTDYLKAASRSFRLGMEAMGSENLTRFIDAVTPVLSTLPRRFIQGFGTVLAESLAAQTRHDFLYLADLLEYQIRPLLEEAEEQIHKTAPKGRMDGH